MMEVLIQVDTVSPTPQTQNEIIAEAVSHFERITDQYIQSKVMQYNTDTGTRFGNIHSCTNYRFDLNYTHQPFCDRVWKWNVAIWEAVRAYQSTLTVIPTDSEFQTVLDAVTF